jgi:NADH dehydrogenase [ubiquinone] 1 alpha subcomplex assembly factor 7
MSPSDLPYDPHARRDTPLAQKLVQRIRREGPITIAEYMRACLTDPEHGYYVKRQAIGADGDFITAPEISQIFGELIGLWCAVVWQQMGKPARFNLVEIGPGRGTLMSDALRAARIVPGFLDAASVVLVDVTEDAAAFETVSQSLPRERLALAREVRALPNDVPTILIANEFLDTCPVQQFEVAGRKCLVRSVGLDARGELAFHSLAGADGDHAELFAANPLLADGDVIEVQDFHTLVDLQFGRTQPWAALFIDYGHFDPAQPRDGVTKGETLQAVRSHTYEHPLTSPGEADLTCYVNFNDVKAHFELAASQNFPRVTVDGPVTQTEFLGRLGIMERASRLMGANPAAAHEIEAGVARLMAVPGMGDRFKVIAVRSANLPPLPGF